MSKHDQMGWFEFQTSSVKGADIKVAAVEGVEALGRPYCFNLDLVTDRYDLDFDAMLRKPGILIMRQAGTAETYYHGIITSIEAHFEVVEDKLLVKLTLEPMFSNLRDFFLNDTYVDNTNGFSCEDLLRTVLKRYGYQEGRDFEFKLSPSPRKRNFIVQYRESVLDFIHRRIEFEGIYYYFEQGEYQEKVVFIDSISSLPVRNAELKYRPIGMFEADLYRISLQAFNEKVRTVSSKSIIQNYNYRHASDMVVSEKHDQKATFGEVMYFGADIRDQSEGDHYAQIRLEEQMVNSRLLRGKGLASGLRPGMGFSVTGHPRNALNSDFRILTIRHQGSQTGYGLAVVEEESNGEDNFYTCEFEAIPQGTEFRLSRTVIWPRIEGYLPGFIDSEGSGKAAEIDNYGRYKVNFPFDVTDHKPARASAWVRLATPYGGPGSSKETGMHFPLLKGAEVVISFMEGDPDQPIITGVLPNSLTPSTVNSNNNTLNRMVSTSSNEVHLDDTPGTQGIRMRSSNGTAMFILGSFGGQFTNLTPEEILQSDEDAT